MELGVGFGPVVGTVLLDDVADAGSFDTGNHVVEWLLCSLEELLHCKTDTIGKKANVVINK